MLDNPVRGDAVEAISPAEVEFNFPPPGGGDDQFGVRPAEIVKNYFPLVRICGLWIGTSIGLSCTPNDSCRRAATPELESEIARLLDRFNDGESLKCLFWELRSYDRVCEPLPMTLLLPSAIAFTSSLELFAESTALAVIIAKVQSIPDDGRRVNGVGHQAQPWRVHCAAHRFQKLDPYLSRRDHQATDSGFVTPGPGKPTQRGRRGTRGTECGR